MDPNAANAQDAAPLCAICQCPLADGEELVACPDCHAPYHSECWTENGGCAIYGCAQVPKVDVRSGLEIPPSFWGRNDKPCPSCGREILAAAVRCRHCGATFASAQPEDAGAFRERAKRDQLAPRLCRQVIWLFIFNVLPCTAPIAAVVALCWWASHRRDLPSLPALHAGLARLALIVGAGQTVVGIVMAVLFAVFRSA